MIEWIISSVLFGTVIMFGALGEIITEKSGHLNLGVPGLMFLGGVASWSSAYIYEMTNANPNSVMLILIPLLSGLIASALGALIYSFFTVTLRANQNITGLALTQLGIGVGYCVGEFVRKKYLTETGTVAGYVYKTSDIYKLNLFDKFDWGESKFVNDVVKLFFSYGFLVYVAIIFAIVIHLFLKRTKTGLNLRAVGENPATADAVGINVTKYKYLANIVGGSICGLGGVFYVLVYANGRWGTGNSIETLGWLAVALVIFATWKPLNTIWGSYLFAFFYWAATKMKAMFTVWKLAPYYDNIIQMLPYLVTIVVLIVSSLRNKKENQPPASLGVNYFREER